MKKQPKQKKIQRNVYFSEKQMMMVEDRARATGLSVNGWIQYVVTKEIEPLIEHFEIASPELEKSIAEGLADYEAGRTTTLRNDKEIDEYLDKLNREVD